VKTKSWLQSAQVITLSLYKENRSSVLAGARDP
jgi:hypothetical protein